MPLFVRCTVNSLLTTVQSQLLMASRFCALLFWGTSGYAAEILLLIDHDLIFLGYEYYLVVLFNAPYLLASFSTKISQEDM